jgi:two-component system, cell cycle sensor histidine kinase and response regulator CckA
MPTFGLQPSGLLQTIFEDIGVGVAVINRDAKLVFANRTALELFGAKAEPTDVSFEDWRRNFRFEDSHGKEIPLERSAITRAMRGERLASEEIRVTMPDGSSKWMLIWAYQFCAMGLDGVMALIIDQTADFELRRAAAQLQRMETLGALAAGLTHDFNNLLNTISTNIALLSNTEYSVGVGVRLEQISKAVDRAAVLVKRLMQFSRKQDLHRRTLQANNVVRDVLQLTKPLLRDNISLRVTLADDLLPIYADSSQVEQVLVNLIVNALDAMPKGGKLGIATCLVHSFGKVSFNGEQEFVRISVVDSGVGIPQELQCTIFEPFFTTKPEGKGTGLGLSSSYGIMRQHNGKIEVESKVGEGSTFNVFFPIARTCETTEAEKAS